MYELRKLVDGAWDYNIYHDNIIAIVSKKLNETQIRYFTYKQELWGLVYCLRKFHTWIWAHRDVTVFVDHRPLIHLLHQQTLSHALQSWLDVILNYDLKIKYRPGVLHVIPDAISRMYANAYVNKLVWGTVSNIKFLDNVTDIMKDAVSSEAKIIESLKSVKPPKPKPTRRFKAQGELESGGGDQQVAGQG